MSQLLTILSVKDLGDTIKVQLALMSGEIVETYAPCDICALSLQTKW